jgi:hypothetical protein
VETDPTRMWELLVGRPDVIIEGVTDTVDGPLTVHVAQRIDDVVACSACGMRAWVPSIDAASTTRINTQIHGRSSVVR